MLKQASPLGRLQRLDADRLCFTLRTPWDDRSYRIVVSPHGLIEKLAALVPVPRLHLIRYHGVLAPHAADRALIVPAANATDGDPPATTNTAPLSPVQRLKWAQLLTRMPSLDITICPRCGATMRLVAALTDPHSIQTYRTGVGLPAVSPR